jgi:hypothetical protein
MLSSITFKSARRLLAATALLLAAAPLAVLAQTSPPMGQAASFAVLGGSTVTNTGSTNILGELGVSPGTAVTGFPPGVVTGGTIHINDAVAQQAQTDLTIAYNALAGQAPTADLSGQDLGGLTLGPGVYRFTSTAQLTGTLTLDAQGDPAAVFIFQIGSTLTTASAANVVMINGGSDCNVYWQVGSSATLGTGSSLAGSILALTSITLTTSANVSGRVLARTGAVTLDTNNVAVCAAGCPPVTLAPATLPNATIGVAYSQTLVASGGTAPYTYTVSAGTPPPGLTLSGAGLLAGNPTTAGSFTFTVTATDANGCVATRVYTLVIGPAGCPVVTVSPTTLPAAILGTPYSQTITATGGTAPYLFSVTAGILPPALTLTPAGLLSGIPNLLGNFSFTIIAVDAAGCPGSRDYVIPVGPPACPVITVLPASLPAGVVGTAYNQLITATGGAAPYVFTVTAGAPPTGLSLSSTGALTGTPSAVGTFAFTVTATDANSCPGSRPYSIAITAGGPGPGPTPTVRNVSALSTWAIGLMVLMTIVLVGVGRRTG